jgi:hypothetical protein
MPMKIPLPVVVMCLVLATQTPCATASAQQMEREFGRHMDMTTVRPAQPGDRERADAIVAAARKVMARYADYRDALAAGYAIFLPGMRQAVYHFTPNADFHTNTQNFDPDKPTSLLYVKVPGQGTRFKIIGVMYAAPKDASLEELNRRVPLSIGRWHIHTNICIPPFDEKVDLVGPDAKFGLTGSIVTPEACKAAHGRFLPHLYGWMVHVYASETNPSKIWDSGLEDEKGMQNMPGMPM